MIFAIMIWSLVSVVLGKTDSSSTSTSERDQNNVIYNDNELTYPLNVSVIMLNRRTALLQWWPRTALMHQDVEIVFTPEYSNYKVVIGLIDPVGNSVELHDLKPYTYYQLDLRDRTKKILFARISFSTAVMDNKLALVYQPHGGGVSPVDVRPSEVGIVGVVLCVWAFAVYIFINQWGKLRSLIPYQPQYKRPELDDEEANNSQCLHCDTQIRQNFDEFYTLHDGHEMAFRQQLLKGRLNNSSIYLGPRLNDGCGWWADVSQSALRKVKSAEHIGIPPTIIVNSSSDESCDEDEDGELLPKDEEPIRRSSSTSRNLLNPPQSLDFYGIRPPSVTSDMSQEKSFTATTASVNLNVLPLISKTKMVHASKKAFLQSYSLPTYEYKKVKFCTENSQSLDRWALIRAKTLPEQNQALKERTPSSPLPAGYRGPARTVPVVIASNPYPHPHRFTEPRRAPVNHPATAAFAELMENSIPQTTDLFNRMYKRPPPTTTSGSVGGGSNGAKSQKVRKKGHSTESTESSTSRHQCSTEQPPPMPTLSTETVQRVGSFRSRLKKQQPISMPEPPGSITGSRSETFVGAISMDAPATGVVTHPIVAVTVHEYTNSDTISHL